jgi:exopolysaccharide production protein ExoQ
MIAGATTHKSSLVRYILASIYILWTSSALGFFDRLVYGEKPTGSKITQAINLLGIATSILLFCWRTHRERPRLNLALPLMVASIVVCSVVWSVDPVTTLTRSIAYLFLVVGAIGLVKTLDANEIMELTASICGVLAAISLLLLFSFPSEAIGGSDGDFHGVFPHKNINGEVMAVGVLAGLHGVRTGGRKLRHIMIIAICALAGILCKSATALVTILAFFSLHIVGSLYVRGGARRAISFFLMFILTSTVIFILTNRDMLFSLLDKDPSLTGRTELWPYVIDAIMRRPLLGWGFAAFWSPLNPYSMEISDLVRWTVPEAHNGLLQALLDVGLIGTVLLMFIWMRNLAMAAKCMNGPAPEIGLTSLLLLVGILLIGVSEQVLVAVDEPTAQFFLLGLICEQALREQASHSRAAARAARRSAKTLSNRRMMHPYPAPIYPK